MAVPALRFLNASFTRFTKLAVDYFLTVKTTVSTITTAAAVTYTANQIIGGFIRRDTAGAARADLLPTAASIYALMKNCKVGDSFQFTIENNSALANAITVTTNTGLTLIGTMTIAQLSNRTFLAVVTQTVTTQGHTPTTPAITIYSLGTAVV